MHSSSPPFVLHALPISSSLTLSFKLHNIFLNYFNSYIVTSLHTIIIKSYLLNKCKDSWNINYKRVFVFLFQLCSDLGVFPSHCLVLSVRSYGTGCNCTGSLKASPHAWLETSAVVLRTPFNHMLLTLGIPWPSTTAWR
jgi:hypothetical protein